MSSTPKLFRKDEVEGKVVVETSGKSIGKATDIAFSLEGTTALIVKGYDGAEIQVTMDRVTGVGDFIVVRREKGDPIPVKKPVPPFPASPAIVTPTSPPKVSIPVTSSPTVPMASNPFTSTTTTTPPPEPVPASPAATTICKNCGGTLRAGARFCTKCGSAV